MVPIIREDCSHSRTSVKIPSQLALKSLKAENALSVEDWI